MRRKWIALVYLSGHPLFHYRGILTLDSDLEKKGKMEEKGWGGEGD